jgi:hypothetical protein
MHHGDPTPTQSTPTQPQSPGQVPTLRIKTHVKAGGITLNHNATLVRVPKPAPALAVKTHVTAGGIIVNT